MFEQRFITDDVVIASAKAMMEDMKLIRQRVAGTNIEGASEFKERVGWKPPIEEDWVKLNVDGAFSDASNMAACGGLLRNRDGTFLQGFVAKLHEGDALYAKL